MYLLLLSFGVLLPAGSLYWYLSVPSAAELEQAALLPFADDPHAAQRLSQETGRCCATVLEPVFEPLVSPYSDRLDA